MFRWVTCRAVRTSARNRLIAAGLSSAVHTSVFRATVSSSTESCASYTSPMPPRARNRTTLYRPSSTSPTDNVVGPARRRSARVAASLGGGWVLRLRLASATSTPHEAQVYRWPRMASSASLGSDPAA